MTIGKRTTTALGVGATIGWLMVLGLPAEAATHRTHRTGHPHPALGCSYRVTDVRPSSFVNIRSGPGTIFRPVSTLRITDGRFRGACNPVNGWVEVTSVTGTNGWVPAHHLWKAKDAGQTRKPGRHALACSYHVTHVRPSSFLNVRSGPGTRFRPVSMLKVTNGRFPGACKQVNGWVEVKSATGKRGWSSARYLRGTTTK